MFCIYKTGKSGIESIIVHHNHSYPCNKITLIFDHWRKEKNKTTSRVFVYYCQHFLHIWEKHCAGKNVYLNWDSTLWMAKNLGKGYITDSKTSSCRYLNSVNLIMKSQAAEG